MNFLERKRTSRDLRGATESDFFLVGSLSLEVIQKNRRNHKENIMKTTTGILTLIGKLHKYILKIKNPPAE